MKIREVSQIPRTIEKKLGATLERRTLEDFDYSVPAQHKETEFARPPREPHHTRRPAAGAKSGEKKAVKHCSPGPAEAGSNRQKSRIHPVTPRPGSPVRQIIVQF